MNFAGNILSLDTVQNIIDVSYIDPEAIQKELDAHPYFTEPSEIPSWRMLWFSHESEPDEARRTVLRFTSDFDKRAFFGGGIIYHVIGLCLWLNEIGEPGWAGSNITDKIEKFIDDTFRARNSVVADLASPEALWDDDFGAEGLGFRNDKDPQFAELTKFYNRKASRWLQDAYPAAAKNLLETLKVDAERFQGLVAPSAVGPATFARLPVLSSVDFDEWLTAFKLLTIANQKCFLRALFIRYENVRYPNSPLASEVDWLRRLHDGLVAYTSTLVGIQAARLRMLVSSYIGAVLKV